MLQFMFASALSQLATATALEHLGIVTRMLSLAAGIQMCRCVAPQVKQSNNVQDQRQWMAAFMRMGVAQVHALKCIN